MTATARAKKDPPYKLLALDGGGIRGALTIEILAEIEEIIQEKCPKKTKEGERATLSDYFDYISGDKYGCYPGYRPITWMVSG